MIVCRDCSEPFLSYSVDTQGRLNIRKGYCDNQDSNDTADGSDSGAIADGCGLVNKPRN